MEERTADESRGSLAALDDLERLQEVLGNDDVGASREGDPGRNLADERGVANQRQQVLVPVLEMGGDDRAKPVESGLGGGMGHDQSIEAVSECRQHLCQGGIGRRLMVTIAVFFIVFVQVAKGLRHNNPTQMELMDSYAATPRQVLLRVRIPNTMPFLFTAIRTAAPIAVIIALVSEYFGGTQDGLGSKISGTLNGSNKALGFAYVVGGSIVGLLFFAGSSLLEYLVVPWQRRRVHG